MTPEHFPFERRLVERIGAGDRLPPGRPAILSGALGDSAALQSWSLARLRDAHGDVEVPVRVSERGAPQLYAGDPRRSFRFERLRLAEIIDGFADVDGPTRYVQLCELDAALPRLAADVPTPVQVGTLYASPPYVWICGADTVTPLHFDFNETLLGQIVGAKRFVLFPPEASRDIAGRLERALYRTTSFDFQRPDLRRFPHANRATAWDATVEPGDVLYIPYRWWHGMLAPAPSLSVTWWWEPSFGSHIRHTLRQRSANIVKLLLRALKNQAKGVGAS